MRRIYALRSRSRDGAWVGFFGAAREVICAPSFEGHNRKGLTQTPCKRLAAGGRLSETARLEGSVDQPRRVPSLRPRFVFERLD